VVVELSAFFWTYTAMQFVSGWVVDSFDVNWVIAAGFMLWSLARAATGLVRGFTMLLAMRLMLGIGESVMSPAYSKILSFHLPEHHRGFANGVLQAAVRSEPAVGTLGTGFLIAKYGWRPAFIGIGLVSLAWIPAWIKWMPRGGTIGRSLPGATGFADILRRLQRSRSRAARWRTLSGTSYVWLPSVWVKEWPVRGHLRFPRRLLGPTQQENGQDCKTASQTLRVSWPRRSPGFYWIGLGSFWRHSRSRLRY